jgi:glycosyltransferase involved in cell wall biosynthesis
LLALPAAELDALIPDHLSHPRRSREFLQSATGVTTIVDRLREVVPADRPMLTFWPAANESIYRQRPPNPELRAALGIQASDTVLFYHGNVHASNAAEVGSLYEAVAALNRRGVRTFLIRAGRDDPGLIDRQADAIRTRLLSLGYVAPRFLAELMRLADYFVQPGLPGAFNDYRFPSKLPEFFAIGRPVILPESNLGTFLRHGEDAFVLPSADAESIAGAVMQLRADPTLTAKLSAGAVAFSEKHFSWYHATDQVLNFYLAHTQLARVAVS